MEKFKIQAIIDLTKTDTWKYIKELFSEKEEKVLKYMRTLDLEDEEQKKTYKKMNENLNAFASLIDEIEFLNKQKEQNQEIEEYNKELEEVLLPK